MNKQRNLLQIVERITKKDSLKFILIVCLIHRLFYFLVLNPFKVFFTPDTITYFVPVSFFNGVVDLLRTPVYPELINLFELLFKDKLVLSIVVFQHIFSLISIIPFHSIVSRLIHNRGLVMILTIYYGCSHLLIEQCGNINPEGICIASSVFYLFILFNFFEQGCKRKETAFLAGFASLLLVMIKPTYLVIPFILILLIPNLAFLKMRPIKKIDFYFFTGIVFCLSFIWVYAEANKRQNGEFALTKVSDINNFSNIIISGGYKHGGDKEFIDIIDTSKSKGYYYSTFLINNNIFEHNKKCVVRYSKYLPTDNEMVKGVEIFKTKDYPSERISKFIIQSSQSAVHKRFLAGKVLAIFRQYWDIALLMLANLFLFIVAYYKKSTVSLFGLFCVFFVFSQFITLAIAGIYNWDRVLIPSYAFILILSGLFIDKVIGIRYSLPKQP
jgi:hypothetical protein